MLQEDYLVLSIDKSGEVEGRFEIHYKDLKAKLGIDLLQSDGTPNRKAAADTKDQIQDYIRRNFLMWAEDTLIVPQFTKVDFLVEDQIFVQYFFTASLEKIPARLSFRHDLIYDVDPEHRGLVVLSQGTCCWSQADDSTPNRIVKLRARSNGHSPSMTAKIGFNKPLQLPQSLKKRLS